VAILNPVHLLSQAEGLIQAPPSGPPKQADLRRAVSAAYYAVFHCTLTITADELVGVTKRNTASYALVYRSVDHGTLKRLCQRLAQSNVPAELLKHFPKLELGRHIQRIASAIVELQEQRHLADYDPTQRYKISDARRAIEMAEDAIRRFGKLHAKRKQAVAILLCFSKR
jgi:uncharacterized protein (UPF0332 family)